MSHPEQQIEMDNVFSPGLDFEQTLFGVVTEDDMVQYNWVYRDPYSGRCESALLIPQNARWVPDFVVNLIPLVYSMEISPATDGKAMVKIHWNPERVVSRREEFKQLHESGEPIPPYSIVPFPSDDEVKECKKRLTKTP